MRWVPRKIETGRASFIDGYPGRWELGKLVNRLAGSSS